MNRIFLTISSFLLVASLFAQGEYSLKEAVDFALKNNINVKNSTLDIADAQLQINEIKTTGLPQISGQFQFAYNPIIPTQLIDAQNFDPNAAPGDVVKFKFGVPWSGQAGVGFNQLIFDATWLVGLKAAKTYMQLANQNLEQSKENIAEAVTKAYYSVLVAEERAKILDLNISRMDSLYRDTKIMNEQGFVEKLDLDRLEVQKNNMVTEKQKVVNLIELTYQLLKYQMGLNLNNSIVLKDKLNDSSINELKLLVNEKVNPEKRIEYQLLQTQRELTNLNVERYKKTAYPSLFLSGNLGASHSNNTFNPFERWFLSSAITFGAKVPIYDSGLRRIQVERQMLNLKKLDQGSEMMLQGFQLQNDQAMISLKNGLESLNTQKRNLDLATEVVRVTKIKYANGLGSNLEIINAEADLKQAQTNYFASLYDVLIAKVDLDKSHGNLLK